MPDFYKLTTGSTQLGMTMAFLFACVAAERLLSITGVNNTNIYSWTLKKKKKTVTFAPRGVGGNIHNKAVMFFICVSLCLPYCFFKIKYHIQSIT